MPWGGKAWSARLPRSIALAAGAHFQGRHRRRRQLRRRESLFLVAAGARTAEACHDGDEKVLKAFREFRVEGEPALHQRFRRSLVDVGHHLLLKLVHHRDLHRRDIREPDGLAGLEGCAIYLDPYFHVPSWPDFDIGSRAAESTFAQDSGHGYPLFLGHCPLIPKAQFAPLSATVGTGS